MLSRREMITGMAAAGALGLGMTPNVQAAGPKPGIKTKRVIFFFSAPAFHMPDVISDDITHFGLKSLGGQLSFKKDTSVFRRIWLHSGL